MAFSALVINAWVDTITAIGNDRTEPIGIYRGGPKIEKFFLDCGIDMCCGTGGRLGATTDALRLAASQWNGDELLSRSLVRVADPRDYLAEAAKSQAVVEHLYRVL
jgi:hypothetical protein